MSMDTKLGSLCFRIVKFEYNTEYENLLDNVETVQGHNMSMNFFSIKSLLRL